MTEVWQPHDLPGIATEETRRCFGAPPGSNVAANQCATGRERRRLGFLFKEFPVGALYTGLVARSVDEFNRF